MIRAASLVAAFIVLVGCSVAPPRDASSQRELFEAQDHREALVKARTHWRLRGRIAVSNGDDGGSGRMDWVQDGEHYEIKLSAPVSRRSWRLVGEPGFAFLHGLDGEIDALAVLDLP